MKFEKDQFKPVIVLFYVVVAASLWKYTDLPIPEPPWRFWFGTYKLFAALILFGLIPMGIVKFVFREKLADYGLRPGVLKFTIRSFLLMSPFIVLIAIWTGHQPAFFDVYPLNPFLRSGGPPKVGVAPVVFAVHAVIYLGYYFGWEFLFRGFLQHGLSERCGVPTAVFVQTLASTMLHYGHPGSEIAGSIIAGIVWGFLAVRTKSILSGFGQHALLGIVLDWTLIYGRH